MTTRSFRINAPIRISSLWGNLEENGRVCLGRLGVTGLVKVFLHFIFRASMPDMVTRPMGHSGFVQGSALYIVFVLFRNVCVRAGNIVRG